MAREANIRGAHQVVGVDSSDDYAIQPTTHAAQLPADGRGLADRLVRILRKLLEAIARKFARTENSPKQSARAFISYAHEDEQAVGVLVSELEKRGVGPVWFAPDQLQPGDQLTPGIRRAIDQSEYVVVAVTQQSSNSAWVAQEIAYAMMRKKEGINIRLIPLYLTSRDVPESLRDYLAIDLREHAYKAGFEDVVNVLQGKFFRGRTPLS